MKYIPTQRGRDDNGLPRFVRFLVRILTILVVCPTFLSSAMANWSCAILHLVHNLNNFFRAGKDV